MNGKRKILLALASGSLALFLLWTYLVTKIDLRPIGPEESVVGFATLNQWFQGLVGTNMTLYHLTDVLGLIPLGIAAGFALLGLWQWIQRKSLWLVDRDLICLGVFYLVVVGAFLFFECVVINYRPVLIEGKLEASYPSSTTLLVASILPTAVMEGKMRIQNGVLRKILLPLLALFTIFMISGRVLSGVHWISDVVGGLLLSTGLVLLFVQIIEK